MSKVKIGNVFPPAEYLLKHCAPTGYGLGNTNGKQVLWADIDTAKQFGTWGIWGDDGVKTVNGLSFTYATVLVIPMDTNAVTQVLLPIGNPGLALVRKSVDDIWKPWEWIDPPMEAGVEYRTTERWMGKPVYTKLIDCGALPINDTAMYTLDIDKKTIVDLNAVAIGASTYKLPSLNETDSGNRISFWNTGVNVFVKTFASGWDGFKLYVTVKYTKD